MSNRTSGNPASRDIRRKPLPNSANIVFDGAVESNHTLIDKLAGATDDESTQLHAKKSTESISAWWRLYHNTWLQELLGIAVGIVCFAALVAVLAVFDGKSLRSWPLAITPGALISVLVTVMDAALTLPLSSAFGQLKWLSLRYKRQNLQRLQQMDFASRSAAGSINLLLSFQGGVIGSTGAVIAVLMLAVGPFAQQVLKYSDGETLITAAHASRAVMDVERVDQSASTTSATLPMRAAIFNAILGYSTNGTLLDPPFSCPTGNCTWDPFLSLEVCSTCTDIHHLLSQTLTDLYIYWSLPEEYNSLGINGWLDDGHPYSALNMTSVIDYGWGPNPSTHFLRVGILQNSISNRTEVTALDCRLHFCLHEITAVVTNGQLKENITDAKATWALADPADVANNASNLTPAAPDQNNTIFFVDEWAPSALANTMSVQFNGTAQNTADGGMMYDSETLFGFWASRTDIPGLMAYLAKSMSIHLRDISSGGSVQFNGSSNTTEQYIVVWWEWLILPIAVVVLVPTFTLILAIETKRTHAVLWKNSMLAWLFHGFDDKTRTKILADDAVEVSTGGIAEMNALAERTIVHLELDKSGTAQRLTGETSLNG